MIHLVGLPHSTSIGLLMIYFLVSYFWSVIEGIFIFRVPAIIKVDFTWLLDIFGVVIVIFHDVWLQTFLGIRFLVLPLTISRAFVASYDWFDSC